MSDDGVIKPLIVRKQQLSQYLGGISLQTVNRMVRDGEFPPPFCYAKSVACWNLDVISAWTRGEWRPDPTRPAPKRVNGRGRKAKAGA
jgi:hypothetical protein